MSFVYMYRYYQQLRERDREHVVHIRVCFGTYNIVILQSDIKKNAMLQIRRDGVLHVTDVT